ncbi:MAG: hypothetical protein ACFFCD_16175 [Promethearchaeota archaeon]
MQFFDFIENALNMVLIVVNTLFIFILLSQFREQKKPLIVTHVISNKKDEKDMPDVLESSSAYNFEHHYIRIINSSKNEAKNLDISYKISFDDKPDKITEVNEKLNYLNPFEMTQIVLRTDIFRNNFPDKFETIDVDASTTLIRPRDRLKMKLDITVTYNPLLFGLKKHVSKDNYRIEWSKLNSEPYELFNCWNKRDGYYIFKKNVSQK